MRRTGVVAAALLAASLLLAAGCSGGSGGSGDGASGGSGGGGGPAGRLAAAAFALDAPALGGGRVVGADYADTGVALWFWAPW